MGANKLQVSHLLTFSLFVASLHSKLYHQLHDFLEPRLPLCSNLLFTPSSIPYLILDQIGDIPSANHHTRSQGNTRARLRGARFKPSSCRRKVSLIFAVECCLSFHTLCSRSFADGLGESSVKRRSLRTRLGILLLSVFFSPASADEGRQACYFLTTYHICNAESSTLLSLFQCTYACCFFVPVSSEQLRRLPLLSNLHFATRRAHRAPASAFDVSFPYMLIQWAALCRPVVLPQSLRDNLVHKQI